MLEKTMVVGAFQCNCRLFVCEKTGKGVLVDPGDEPEKIISELNKIRTSQGQPIQIEYLLHTHGHLDHIGGTRGVSEALVLSGKSPRRAIHSGDLPLYQGLKMQGQLFGFQYEDPLPIEYFLQDEETLRIGHLRMTVLHTPGHSPGSISIRIHEDSSEGVREQVLTGDTLFQGNVGRTDLWGANEDQMFKSIRQRLLCLDDDTRVCPGHGADSSIGVEKRKNPYLI